MGVPIINWHGSYVFVPKPKPKSIHVRIVSTYPPVFFLPEETTDVTLEVRPEFARTPDEAHRPEAGSAPLSREDAPAYLRDPNRHRRCWDACTGL